MLRTAWEIGTQSSVTFSYGLPLKDIPVWAIRREFTYTSFRAGTGCNLEDMLRAIDDRNWVGYLLLSAYIYISHIYAIWPCWDGLWYRANFSFPFPFRYSIIVNVFDQTRYTSTHAFFIPLLYPTSILSFLKPLPSPYFSLSHWN